MTLTEFLLVRIAEDEAMARDSICPCGGPACNVEAGWYREDELTERLRDFGHPTSQVAHILHWDPARVLAECKAKRRIIDRYENGDFEAWWADREYPNYVFPFLALPYADHPDYQDEWKPA